MRFAGVRLDAVPGPVFIDVASLVLLTASAPAVVVPGQLVSRTLDSITEQFFNCADHKNLL
jgi:hypothetical protein